MGRVWPNGEFCLWSERRSLSIEPERASDIGLSKVANSHIPSEPRVQRVRKGLNGITKYGQRMIVNSAYLMQQAWGRERLSFLTCTLPGEAWQTVEAAERWAEIVRRFMTYLKRELEKHGLPYCVASVTEIQPKRAARDGGCPLHLHMVFKGAHERYKWCIRPSRLQFLWSKVVLAVCPSYRGLSFEASCNVQSVKSSASGYLGKYMSKGSHDIKESIKANGGCVDHLPSHWYNLSAMARELVKKNTAFGPNVGTTLDRWMGWRDGLDSPITYSRSVVLYALDGQELCSFVVGTVATHWKKNVGVPVSRHDIRGV